MDTRPEKGHLKPGDTVSGVVSDLAYGGAGVLRVSGWVVMVPGAFPSDRILARLRRKRRGIYEGELTAVEEASPDRVPAACPHAALCGGCALQGLSPAAQTQWKNAQARELLRRIGHVEPEQVEQPWSPPAPWFYRNKMEFTFSRRPWIERAALDRGDLPGPGPALGLHPRGRFDAVFDVSDCRLQSPLSNHIVEAVRREARTLGLAAYNSHKDQGLLRHLVIRRSATTPDLLIVLVARLEDPALARLARAATAAVPEITGAVAAVNLRRATVAQGDYELPLLGERCWHETVAGIRYRIGASSFFQTQTAGAEALVATALEWGAPKGGERILDLYCGAGTFSLPLARRARALLGVESFPGAVDEARANAQANGIPRAEFLCAVIEERGEQPWQHEPWDLVLLDPPRSGLHPRALEKVRALQAPRILYISCNPSTLARDAGVLVNEAGYRPRRLRVFDLFPQTPHLESMLLLQR
ncbi:MAG: 23S rRNA (uracil(1939)-C(5))-methyltransferase RlmD [Candidatus Eisenbacteria bacterium]